MRHKQIVLIIDYGSQYTQLIARRIREQSVYSEILPHSVKTDEIIQRSPTAVVLSGGPDSVYAEAHLSSILPLWRWISLSLVSATDLDSS